MSLLSTTPFSLLFSGAGTAINSTYPTAVLLDTFKWPQALGILEYQMTTSFNAQGIPGIAGVFFVIGTNDPTLVIGRDSRMYGSKLYSGETILANSGNDVYSSKWYGNGIEVPANMPISMYGSAPNSALVNLVAIITFQTTPIK